MTYRATRHLAPLFFLLLVAGCDSSPASDAGPDDSGPITDDGGPVGTDGGALDAGPLDAGPTDAGPDLGPHSIITVRLPTGEASFAAQTADGSGVVVNGGYALATGEVYFIAGAARYRLDKTTQTLIEPTDLLNEDESANLSPDYVLTTPIDNVERMIAVAGTRAFLWDEAPATGAPRFGPGFTLMRCEPGMCEEANRTAFAPQALHWVTIDLGAGPSSTLIAVAPNQTGFMLEHTVGVYFVASQSMLCAGGTAPVEIDELTMSVRPGGAATDDAVMMVRSGNEWHVLEAGTTCFGAGVPLLDGSGAPIAEPTAFFGANYADDPAHNRESLIVTETAP